jgi:hypothetical protein
MDTSPFDQRRGHDRPHGRRDGVKRGTVADAGRLERLGLGRVVDPSAGVGVGERLDRGGRRRRVRAAIQAGEPRIVQTVARSSPDASATSTPRAHKPPCEPLSCTPMSRTAVWAKPPDDPSYRACTGQLRTCSRVIEAAMSLR